MPLPLGKRNCNQVPMRLGAPGERGLVCLAQWYLPEPPTVPGTQQARDRWAQEE